MIELELSVKLWAIFCIAVAGVVLAALMWYWRLLEIKIFGIKRGGDVGGPQRNQGGRRLI